MFYRNNINVIRCVLLIATVVVADTAWSSYPLVYSDNLIYLGGFRLPEDPEHGGTLWESAYGGPGVAYRPPTETAVYGSLFFNGQEDRIAEIGIPNPATWSTSSTVSNLPRASLIQNHVRVYGTNQIDYIHTDRTRLITTPPIGGLMVAGNTLYGTSYDHYPYAADQERAVWTMPFALSSSSGAGSFQPIASVSVSISPTSRMIAGHLTSIPSAYQASLGGDVLAGLHNISIAGTTSYGPTVFSFSTSDLINTSTPYDVTPLMYSSDSGGEVSTIWGGYSAIGETREMVAATDTFGGVVFPEGTRAVLFISRHGTGPVNYGRGTSNIALDGTYVSGDSGPKYWYDPDNANDGEHAYPYVYRIMAFDADDLVAVKNGTKEHNAVAPYSYWDITLPTPKSSGLPRLGATYDAANQIVYVSQANGDGDSPVFHAFRVSISSGKRYANAASVSQD